jgi:F5/8 type C domain/PKD domain
MSPALRLAATALVALATAVAAAAPAHAALGIGISGYVTDADTGLRLDQATVTWAGTTSPLPQATTDVNGRFLFFGLDPNTSGTLQVAGPPGWDHVDVGPIALPGDGVVTQNVEVHRDWALPAGGATVSSNDESGAAGGCGSGAAADGNGATGWSASATRPAGDPPTLTVALPATVDVSAFVLDAGAACGHPDGATLGRYRVETSGDGSTWSNAAEGELGAGDRGNEVSVTPTANAAVVRFVRLTALSPQDPASPTVDLRELKVYGAAPGVPPTGTLAPEVQRNYMGQVVRLHATFTDTDSNIIRYLWDFDGDGNWDQATLGPQVSHVWAGAGMYHVTVGARDFRGALGTSSIDLRIINPNALIDPIPQRKPLVTFDPPNGIDLSTRIACASICRYEVWMKVTTRMARKLHLKHRTIVHLKRKTEGPGLGSWTMELPSSFIKKLRRAHLKKVTLRLTATAIDQQKRRSTVHRWVTFR